MTRARHGLILAITCLLAAGGVAACGSDDDGGSSTSSTGGGTGSATSFTYGYSIPTGQNPWIGAIADATDATARSAGGRPQRTDAQLDPAKQVQQVNRFITEGVKAIAVAPAQVPESLQGSLSKAVAQDIHVLALEWSFSDDPSAPPEKPVDGQANADRGQLGKDVAKAAMDDAGGTAKIVYVGLPFPVRSIDFFEKNLKASLTGGSKIVANLDNPTDNAQGALKPLNGALAAHPEANAIVTYNGPSALAAVRAVKAAGRAGKVKIYNIQLDAGTAPALKAGTIEACWDLNPPSLGKALGGLIAAAATGKPKSEWAKTVVVPAPKYTKDNIADWKDWTTGG